MYEYVVESMFIRLSPDERAALECRYREARRELLDAGFAPEDVNRLMPVNAHGGLDWDVNGESTSPLHAGKPA